MPTPAPGPPGALPCCPSMSGIPTSAPAISAWCSGSPPFSGWPCAPIANPASVRFLLGGLAVGIAVGVKFNGLLTAIVSSGRGFFCLARKAHRRTGPGGRLAGRGRLRRLAGFLRGIALFAHPPQGHGGRLFLRIGPRQGRPLRFRPLPGRMAVFSIRVPAVRRLSLFLRPAALPGHAGGPRLFHHALAQGAGGAGPLFRRSLLRHRRLVEIRPHPLLSSGPADPADPGLLAPAGSLPRPGDPGGRRPGCWPWRFSPTPSPTTSPPWTVFATTRGWRPPAGPSQALPVESRIVLVDPIFDRGYIVPDDNPGPMPFGVPLASIMEKSYLPLFDRGRFQVQTRDLNRVVSDWQSGKIGRGDILCLSSLVFLRDVRLGERPPPGCACGTRSGAIRATSASCAPSPPLSSTWGFIRPWTPCSPAISSRRSSNSTRR